MTYAVFSIREFIPVLRVAPRLSLGLGALGGELGYDSPLPLSSASSWGAIQWTFRILGANVGHVMGSWTTSAPGQSKFKHVSKLQTRLGTDSGMYKKSIELPPCCMEMLSKGSPPPVPPSTAPWTASPATVAVALSLKMVQTEGSSLLALFSAAKG